MSVDLTFEHTVLDDARRTRRYFAKFERIIEHLDQVALLSAKERFITVPEAAVLQEYLDGLARTFTALSYKFLMANRVSENDTKLLTIDKSDSGFPVFSELLQMAADSLQADNHLKSLPDQKRLKQDMVSHILTHQTAPTKLQYALSQRIYYEHLQNGDLFLSQNDPQAMWTDTKKSKSKKKNERSRYLIYWAKYDSQMNVPNIYLMEVEDSGRKPLPNDERRWPRVQSHLMAQAVSSLKLLTIARGFDRDFDDLHPKTLKRFHIGPMYSHAFTEQHGPLRDVLAEASGQPGLDWALTWTAESLVSEKTKREKTGLFSTAEREVFKIDKADLQATEDGASSIRRSLILPHRAFQVLEEKNPASLRGYRKYVVGENDKIISYR